MCEKSGRPIHVELWNYHQFGLRAPSTMLIEQITTIKADALDKCIGSVADKQALSSIWEAMSIQFHVLESSA